jgi:hypothetical protein
MREIDDFRSRQVCEKSGLGLRPRDGPRAHHSLYSLLEDVPRPIIRGQGVGIGPGFHRLCEGLHLP